MLFECFLIHVHIYNWVVGLEFKCKRIQEQKPRTADTNRSKVDTEQTVLDSVNLNIELFETGEEKCEWILSFSFRAFSQPVGPVDTWGLLLRLLESKVGRAARGGAERDRVYCGRGILGRLGL